MIGEVKSSKYLPIYHRMMRKSDVSMRRKRNRITKIRFLKFISLLMLCPFTSPVKCNERNSNWNETEKFLLPKGEIGIQRLESQYSVEHLTAKALVSTQNGIITPKLSIGWTVMAIFSTVLISFILEYLNNTSPVKECILLYLCKDVCKIFLLFVWILYFGVLDCLIVCNGTYLGNASAKLFTFTWIFLSLYLLLTLNIIGAIKFYIMKELKLDPPMPWNQDEYVVSKKFRLTSMLLSFLFVLTSFTTGGYPKIYFNLIGDNRPFSQLPILTSINSGMITILLISYMVTLIGGKVYQTRLELTTQPRLFSETAQSWFLIAACLLGVGIITGFLFNVYGGGNIWIVLFLFQLKTTIITPISIIYCTPELRTFVKCTIRNIMDYIWDVINYSFSKISKAIQLNRSSQIQPII